MQEFTIQRFRGGFAVVWEEDGKRRRLGLKAQSRKEAEGEARDLIRKEKSVKSGLTVSDIWSEYRRDNQGRSIAVSMDYTGRSILPFFGHLRPDQITAADCKRYIAERRAAGWHDLDADESPPDRAWMGEEDGLSRDDPLHRASAAAEAA